MRLRDRRKHSAHTEPISPRPVSLTFAFSYPRYSVFFVEVITATAPRPTSTNPIVRQHRPTKKREPALPRCPHHRRHRRRSRRTRPATGRWTRPSALISFGESSRDSYLHANF